MLGSRVHRNDEDVMYRFVEDLVPGPVEGCQWKQSDSVVERSNVEGGEREEDFDCCAP